MPILERFCLIYLRSGWYTCWLMKQYMPGKEWNSLSDTMVGSVKVDRRTGDAEVSSEVHQNATKCAREVTVKIFFTKGWLDQLMNELIKKVFVEQPLALPGSANNIMAVFRTWWQCECNYPVWRVTSATLVLPPPPSPLPRSKGKQQINRRVTQRSYWQVH